MDNVGLHFSFATRHLGNEFFQSHFQGNQHSTAGVLTTINTHISRTAPSLMTTVGATFNFTHQVVQYML